MVRIQPIPCRRGEILIGFDVIDNWDIELKEMNRDKVGEPFHYPNTFLFLLGYAKVSSSPYSKPRNAQGHAKENCSQSLTTAQ